MNQLFHLGGKSLEALKSPTRIKNLEIRNRVVMPPMVTNFAADTGGVTRQLIEYHVERSKGGLGCKLWKAPRLGPSRLAG